MTIRQKVTWTFLLGDPLAFALLVCQCSCSSPIKRVELPPVPQPKSRYEIAAEKEYWFDAGSIKRFYLSTNGWIEITPQTNKIRLEPQWEYPITTNVYRWSLETSTDFKTWQTVTNYPAGYTGDDVVPDLYDLTPHWYRMRGDL